MRQGAGFPNLHTTAALVLFTIWPSGMSVFAQSVPARLRQALTAHLHFTAAEIDSIESGKAVAHLVETSDPEDVFIVGAIRISALPDQFVDRYRQVTQFESGPGITGGAKFSTPPNLTDLAGLNFIQDEIDDIRDCEPGDCSFKIGDRGLQRIRSGVNWKGSGYVSDANKLIRGMWLEYLQAYQAKGNTALAAYHDTDRITRVEEGLTKLVKGLPLLSQYVPETASYLLQFPQGKPSSAEEFYYWQIAEFGLKPLHRVTHVIIEKRPAQQGTGYLIASKMLYASHYFRSALELRFLVPAATAPGGHPGMFLVVLQRSYVDGLSGMKGMLIRKPVLGKSRDALERYLLNSKTKLESGARALHN